RQPRQRLRVLARRPAHGDGRQDDPQDVDGPADPPVRRRLPLRPRRLRDLLGAGVSSPLFDITGRLALVTGSSRGLGLALATGLARHGARVVLHGRNREALARAREQVAAAGDGAEVPAVSFDVTDAAAVRDGVTALV